MGLFDKPDFPEGRGSSQGSDISFSAVLALIFVLAIVVSWVFAVFWTIHGAFSQDLWEFIQGIASIVVLAILAKVLRSV